MAVFARSSKYAFRPGGRVRPPSTAPTGPGFTGKLWVRPTRLGRTHIAILQESARKCR